MDTVNITVREIWILWKDIFSLNSIPLLCTFTTWNLKTLFKFKVEYCIPWCKDLMPKLVFKYLVLLSCWKQLLNIKVVYTIFEKKNLAALFYKVTRSILFIGPTSNWAEYQYMFWNLYFIFNVDSKITVSYMSVWMLQFTPVWFAIVLLIKFSWIDLTIRWLQPE